MQIWAPARPPRARASKTNRLAPHSQEGPLGSNLFRTVRVVGSIPTEAHTTFAEEQRMTKKFVVGAGVGAAAAAGLALLAYAWLIGALDSAHDNL